MEWGASRATGRLHASCLGSSLARFWLRNDACTLDGEAKPDTFRPTCSDQRAKPAAVVSRPNGSNRAHRLAFGGSCSHDPRPLHAFWWRKEVTIKLMPFPSTSYSGTGGPERLGPVMDFESRNQSAGSPPRGHFFRIPMTARVPESPSAPLRSSVHPSSFSGMRGCCVELFIFDEPLHAFWPSSSPHAHHCPPYLTAELETMSSNDHIESYPRPGKTAIV
jgi:hypothetical protein